MKKALNILFIAVLAIFGICHSGSVAAQTIINTVAGGGSSYGDGGAATAASLNSPTCVAVDAAGNMYIADYNDQTIRFVNGSTNIISTIAGIPHSGGVGTDGVAATLSKLNQPNGVAFDAAGNFYIAEQGGGVVRKVNSAGIISTIAGLPTASGFTGDGIATAVELYEPTNVVVDAVGNVYVADWDNNRVRVITTDGYIHTVGGGGTNTGYGGPATAAHLQDPYSVSLDGYGSLYVSDEGGQRLVRIDLATDIIYAVGGIYGTSGSTGDGGPATAAKFDLPDGIVADAGSLYICDYGNDRIQQVNIATDNDSTAIGITGVSGFFGDGGQATAAKLNGPAGVAIDVYGNIYIADFGNNRIRKVGSGNHPPVFVNGETQTFNVCENSAPDSLNSLLAASDLDVGQTETWTMRYGPFNGYAYVNYSTTSTGGTMTPVGLYYIPNNGYSGPDSFKVLVNDGISVDSTLIRVNVEPFYAGVITPQPTIVCPGNSVTLSSDSSGGSWNTTSSNLTVSGGGLVTGETAGYGIVSYSKTNSCGTTSTPAEVTVGDPIVTTIAGGGSSLGDGGPATAGTLDFPVSIYVDASNNKYVTDYLDNRLREINSSGTITTVVGTGAGTSTGDGGLASLATVNSPAGIYKDATGNIYVTEQGGCRVRKINTSGIISTIAGTGTCSTSGDGLAATNATINEPTSVTVDPEGNIYIAEWGGGRVRKVNPAGYISTFAGTGSTVGDGGPATAARLVAPYWVSLDGLGNMFISDENDYRVREVNLSTNIITTFAGTGVSGFSGDNGPATGATFAPLGDVYADAMNVYIADGDNERLRMVNRGTGIITTIAGTGSAGFSGDNGPATAAQFHTVSGVALDAAYNIYIVDRDNERVREISPVDPFVASITGTATLCDGTTTTLNDVTPNGSWSSSNAGVASVGTGTGIVTGNSVGTAIITYSVLFPCGTLLAVQTVTVTAPPDPITGNPAVCLGSTSQLNDDVSGGTWSSSNASTATVSGSGLVFGAALGTSIITYSLSAGCNAYLTVTVNPSPLAITPASAVSICTGTFFDFADASGSGTWSSSSVLIASVTPTVGASTAVYGVAQGDAMITYTNSYGCYMTKSVAVTQSPVPLSPTTASFCQFTTYDYTDVVTGGVWSSSASGIASVTSGAVSGVSAGTAVISYSVGACITTATVTVNAAPSDVTGTYTLCAGSTTTLIGTPTGGTWTSNNLPVATITSGGLVDGVSAGTSIISYALSPNCYMTRTITVTTAPNPLSGPISVCTGSTIGLSDLPTGGTWTSSAPAVASIASGTGVLTGASAGTASITYSLGTGCIASELVTVNPTPGAISGTNNICQGFTALLSESSSGGAWSSTNGAVASVTAGTVTGVGAGTATISYTFATGCNATFGFTVNPNPAVITGTKSFCSGTTSLLSDVTSGGTWASSNNTVATVAGGTVDGLTGGTASITYALSTGCLASTQVTINQTPGAIIGVTALCSGGTTTLSDGTLGGTWTSSNPIVATINSSGFVNAVTVGSSTITYTLGSCYATTEFVVNSGPAGITGNTNICLGTTTQLNNTVSGGTWMSTTTSVGTIGSGSGLFTSVSVGQSVVTYNLGAGCLATTTVVVNANPGAISPSGAVSICPGGTVVLGDLSSGNWSSSNTGVATVGVSSGIVSGVAAGTATISYINAAGCYALKTVTVNIAPSAISPSAPLVCVGATTNLTDGLSGGTWGINSTTYATVGLTTGMVTGVAAGSAIVTYTVGSCYTTVTVAVSGLLSAGSIAGSSVMCATIPITLTDGATGGTWSSGNTSVATVGATTGIVSGVGSGTVLITYSVTNTCGTTFVTHSVNVSVYGSGAIVGSDAVCAGTFKTYTDAVTGGVWSVANTDATVTAGGGLVTGITPGSDIITYTVTNTCGTSFTTKTITVGAYLTAGTITGASTVCEAAFTNLVDLAPAGVWTSSNATATVSAGGLVIGVSAGVDTISYTVTSSCGSAYALHEMTVNPLPFTSGIIGPGAVCLGGTATYSDDTIGGTWSVANGTATINSSGVLSPLSMGTNIVTYSVTNGCGTAIATQTVYIGLSITAGSISGPTSVCAGAGVLLADGATGGVWSTSNTDAIVSGGFVTGVSGGVDTISYTVSATCGSVSAIYSFTVIPIPNAGTITGPSNICLGSPTTYTDAAGSGVWSLGSATATISAGGLVTPVSVGTNIVSYKITNSCGTSVATENISIGTSPSAGSIGGSSVVCLGSPTTLTDGVTGGVWSASNANATVSGGVVTGVTVGVDTISYSITTSCGSAVATYAVSVNVSPTAGAIVGPSALCVGSFVNYIDAAPGGVWTISNASATISGSGLVTPVSAGTNIVSYSVTGGCGTVVATKAITTSTSASAGTLAGPTGVCIGSSITLTSGVAGGTWLSSNPAVATVAGGVVDGLSVGTTVISYTVTNGCGTATATSTITSSVAPNAGTIVGPSDICAGAYTIYTDAAPGGVWSVTNSNGTMAGGGTFTAVVPFSTDTVVYTVTNGCGTATASQVVAIGTLLSAGSISSPGGVCGRLSVTVTDAFGGGVWSSSNPAVATIGSSSGIVTGVAPGTTMLSYSVTISCGTVFANSVFTVSSFPTAGSILGPTEVCDGSQITLSGSVPGGAWSASNSNATITAGGLVSGLVPGLDTITYLVTNYCGSAATSETVAVNTFPVAGVISGPSSVCPGSSISLFDAAPGGVWVSENGDVNVGSISGVVTGVTSGSDMISYVVTNGCGTVYTDIPFTVNPGTDSGTITGPDTVCMASSVLLSDAVTGGVWSAGNANAVVSASGLVTGVAFGTDVISYTVTNSCGTFSAIKVVAISPTPDPGVISGSSSVCVGSGITLTESIAGGSWAASNGTASVVGPGIIDGVTVGIDTVFYLVTNGCGTTTTSKILNVDPVPTVMPISGPTSECPGTTVSLTDATTGGTWTSSNPGIASVGASTGVVTGVAAGTTLLTYTVTNSYGCPTSVSSLDTVVTTPAIPAITGSGNICVGATATLGDADAGGTWTSGSTSVASINASSGLLMGLTSGTATISYTVVNICGTSTVTTVETVNLLPIVAAIAGTAHECQGSSTMLTDATSGGMWSSSDPAVATIGSSSGSVMGVAAGAATIVYTYTNTFGCSASVSAIDTVVAAPVVVAITGVTNECIGGSETLSDATAGGTWSSSNASVASIGASSGMVSGIASGVVTINYTVTNFAGCTAWVTTADTVNAMPVESSIAGTMSICIGSATTLSNIIPFGVWSSANTAIATINAASGLVTGVAAGTDKIYYSVSNSCGSALDSAMVTVDAMPSAGTITAAYTTICSGTTVHLTDAATGGVWGSAEPTIATVSSAGIVTGVSAGSALITYTVTNTSGCTAIASIVINVAGSIPAASVSPAGTVTLCHGNTITMEVSATGAGLTYQWLRNGAAIAGAVSSAYTTTTAGVYSVQISNGSCSETITGPTITPPPTPVVSYSPPDELYTGTFSTYQWYRNGTAIGGANSSTYYYSEGGDYSVEVTNSTGCTETSIPYSVSGVSAVNVVVNNTDVKVYPNPASSMLNIDAPIKVNATILGIDGVTLMEVTDATSIDISRLAVGMYMVQVYDGNGILLKTAKFAKID